ncbi:MAG TPA: sigma-70 family RNA polymerase sigma factor [Pyrinomonadaceae bacterium]|jgi:RNA polymerase sigma-70 factor (ECF subfamily)
MQAEAVLNGPRADARAASPETTAARASDYELAQRAAAGDMQAFEELFRKHRRLVYGLSLRMTQDVAEAEDITQEVFVLLFRKVGGFRGEANFTTWLHRLTVNQVLMRFRRNKSRREDSLEDEEGQPREPASPAAPRSAQLIDHIALESAIAQLPPGYRAAFILHDIEGYDHEEVARLLGCAVGTSKSQLHKARTKLRKILASRQ